MRQIRIQREYFGPIAAAGLQMGMGILNNEMQYAMQDRMARDQVGYSKQLMDYQQQKQLEMWQKTGYGPQIEQMKKAGLNPGLMYGMGGGGAQTTGNTGASAPMGHASAREGEYAAIASMGIQSQLAQAQKDVLTSQAEKLKAETESIRGTETEESKARTETLLQGVDNERQKFQLLKIEETLRQMENFEKQATQANRMEYIEYQTKQAMKQLELLKDEAFISNATIDEKIKIIQQAAIGAALNNILTKEQIGKTKEETNAIATYIQQAWSKLALDYGHLEEEKEKTKIEKFKAELDANFPGLGETSGRIINDALEAIHRIMTGKPRPTMGASTNDKK